MGKIDDAYTAAFLEPGVPERNMACLDCPCAWWPKHDGEICQCGVSGLEFFVVRSPDPESYSAYSEAFGIRVSATTEDDVIALFFQEAKRKEEG